MTDARLASRSRGGFTIVELLAVIAIIAILAAFLLPLNRSAGPAVHRAQCVNNLKHIALALHSYEQTYGAFPPAHTVDASGRPLHSWRTLILPFLEQQALYGTIDLAKPWNDPANAPASETVIPAYRCTETRIGPNATTYLAIASPGGALLPTAPRPLSDITDARGSTLLVIEAGVDNAVPWMAPVDADEAQVLSLGPATKTNHAGGGNAMLVDGSVRFLKGSTPAPIRRALLSIAGGDDALTRDW